MNLKPASIALIAFGIASIRDARAYNYLLNPGFEQWDTFSNGTSSFSGTGTQASAALDWDFYNVNVGSATADEVTPPPGLPGSGDYSLLVTESIAGNSIVQNIGTVSDPAIVQSVSGWVYLNSGSVAIGVLNNSAQFVPLAATSTTGGWVYLSANTDYGTEDFLIAATSANSSFYADNMDADSEPLTPEPASFAALGLGALALLRRRNRKK